MATRNTPSPNPVDTAFSSYQAITHKPSILALDLCLRKDSEKNRQLETEAQELSRIMDPIYLPRRTSKTGHPMSRAMSGGGYYVDTAGHLHDIDHRPFPLLSSGHCSPNDGHSTDTTISSNDSWTTRLPKRSRTSLAYWETFTFPHMQSTYLESYSSLHTGFETSALEHHRNVSCVPYTFTLPASRACSYSHFDNTAHYSVNGSRGEPTVHIDGGTGRRVLTKNKKRTECGFLDVQGSACGGREGNSKEEALDVRENGEERSERGNSMAMSPKQKLHRTWVATAFSARLKWIRTQRWLRGCINGQEDRV